MSKTVYLITKGGFFAFGPGCAISIDAGNVMAVNPSGWAMQLQFMGGYSEKSVATHALWASAIATAPDGALLRWDDELSRPVDELAPADHFVETPLLTVPEVEAAPVHASTAVRLRGGV